MNRLELCPGIDTTVPSGRKRPMRGPTMRAPAAAAKPFLFLFLFFFEKEGEEKR